MHVPTLLGRCSRQRLVKVRREPVAQLACVSRQIESHLLKLIDHHATSALVTTKLAIRKLLALANAADDGPHQQVRHINRYGLGQARELGGVSSDRAGIAASIQGKNLEAADFLRALLVNYSSRGVYLRYLRPGTVPTVQLRRGS